MVYNLQLWVSTWSVTAVVQDFSAGGDNFPSCQDGSVGLLLDLDTPSCLLAAATIFVTRSEQPPPYN